MQCLFCGKELALLKRLRGGGEFCSEAHRKEYQEQYEQLALARLLQAKPPAEPASPVRAPLNAPDPRLESRHTESPASVATFEARDDAPEEAPAPVTAQQPDAWQQPAEESDPAPMAGFLAEPVVPAVTQFDQAGLIELNNTWERVATLPSFSPRSSANGSDLTNSESSGDSKSQGCLPPAPRVALSLSLQALEHHTRTSERGLELREFTSPAPVMELLLRPETGSEPAGADDVMEILMSPHPPQKAKPWLGLPRGFPSAPAELGDLARLDFATTGFAYSDGPPAAPQAAVLAPEIPQAPPQVFHETPPQAPVYAEPAPEAFIAPAEPVSQPSLAAIPDVTEPVPPESVAPELVTQALPVTLHGLAAARGKLAQAFPTALTAASDVQIPPSTTLPLRPVIVFGPAPAAARTPETPAAPKAAPSQPKEVQPKQAQPAPAQSLPPQSRPVQPTPAQPKAEERPRSSVVPAPKPVPIKRQAAAEAPVPEKVQARVPEKNVPKAATRQESPAPKSWESAAPSESAIPYELKATESAWSKLSAGVKIGVAAGLVVAISGVAYLVTRGNGKNTPETPVSVSSTPAVATGVAISGGWIDDWANSAKSKRHISLLSGSAKLSDYRLEFQAQIESKAIGWIFRGLNPRNYYVTKLEIVTPGLEPTIALVHFAVVDGQDENRVVVPLPLKVRVDTTYKIRFDAIGNHFATWVQGQKIDEWTDSRFGSGGVGFFSERDEKAAMQGQVNVVPLIPKN
ncbi:MAG: hypothetical protein LAP61_00775 [Acidobacteriia bacterium]|nr:hypothetical protein [Terriglobia bacterium]